MSSLTGMVVQPNKAVVGRNAFTHESGIHQDGLLKHRKTYEIMRPEDVGFGETQLVLGKHSGRHALESRLHKLGYKLSSKELDKAFQTFKQLADKKKEVFDDDLVALVDTEIVSAPKTYELIFLSVLTHSDKAPKVALSIRHKGKAHDATGSGNGPVDAAYKIIDKMVNPKTRLLDYQIRSVTVGKDAQGEVTVKVQDQKTSKVVIGQGVSTDVIEASVRAYLDAINKIVHRSGVLKKESKAYGV